MAQVAREIRTRRIVIEDTDGNDRVIAEVRDGVAELRLVNPDPIPGRGTCVVLFSAPSLISETALGPGLGIQLWANGNALVEIDAWPDELGQWRTHFHLGE